MNTYNISTSSYCATVCTCAVVFVMQHITGHTVSAHYHKTGVCNLHNLSCYKSALWSKCWNVKITGLDYSEDQFFNHVFLEHHLEPWCPRSGPVRTFMETVCLGLSQNPYMASEKKKDTILWFKDYFERPENREILVHSGYWEDSEGAESASN